MGIIDVHNIDEKITQHFVKRDSIAGKWSHIQGNVGLNHEIHPRPWLEKFFQTNGSSRVLAAALAQRKKEPSTECSVARLLICLLRLLIN